MDNQPTPLTELELNAIAARAAAATPGPWRNHDTHLGQYGYAATVLSGEGNDTDLRAWLPTMSQTPWDETRNVWADAAFVAAARTDVPALLAELRWLQDELAEVKASQDPRLRCLIVKAAPDKDMYIGWSNLCEMPSGVWSRETALAYGFPRSRLDRADKNGSTDLSCGDGHWDDPGFVAEQLGWLRRDRLGEYAVEYIKGDRQAAYTLLEPFEGETEVRRPGGA